MWWTTSGRVPRRLHPRCSSPCLCASSRPTRWGPQADVASVYLLLLLYWQGATFPPGQMGSSLVSGLDVVSLSESRALAASVPQDVACSPKPNNRKGQLGLTLGLQLWCLEWFIPPLPLLSPSTLPPDSLTLPHHTAHFLRLFSVWIYGICLRKCATQGFLHMCVSVWVFMCNLKE